MGARKKNALSAGKTMSINSAFYLGGGGGILVFLGGERRFYYYGREDFSDFHAATNPSSIFTKTIEHPPSCLGLLFPFSLSSNREIFQYLSLQSNLKTWLVHAKVREPHLNPPVRTNFPGFSLQTRARRRKFIRTGGVQMWFANLRVNQPCFRLDCREKH